MNNFREKKNYTVDKASLFLFVFVIMFFLLQIVISVLAPLLVNQEIENVFLSLISPTALIVSCLIASRSQKIKLKEACVIKKFDPLYIIVAVMIAVGMFLGLGFINNAVANFLFDNGLNVPTSNLNLKSEVDFVFCVVIYAVLPAIFEEMFFRGALLHGRDRTSIPIIILLAFSFAVYHSSAVQLVYQFVYGVLLVFLAVSSGSIIAGIVAHFLNNFAVILFTYFKINVDLNNPVLIAIGLGTLILAVVTTLMLGGGKQIRKGVKGEVSIFLYPLGIMAIGLFVLVIILGTFG